MLEPLGRLVSSREFMPHGHCYLWQPGVVWLHAVSDALIAAAYLAIAATLAILVHRLRDVPFKRVYLAFGLFVVASGLTHLMDVVTPWRPAPAVAAALRIVAAASAVGAALLLPSLLPKAVAVAEGVKAARERGLKLETAYRDLNAALEKARSLERIKSQLFANVSHELRTPLTLILGPTERMLAERSLGRETRADLEVVAKNARLLLKHVNDLLDLARSEAHKLKAQYSQTDLADLVRSTSSNFDALARERRASFTVEVPESLPAELDVEKVQRIVLNLLSNAFKFTLPGGRVRCTARVVDGGASSTWVGGDGAPPRDPTPHALARVDGARATIEVADSGPGVPPAHREAVFERFHQLEGGATRRFGGTGLGLAIVKDFVELLGGSVSVGDAPEGGASFRVELPIDAPAEAVVSSGEDSAVMNRSMLREAVESLRVPATPPVAADDALEPLVLVIEDNPDMNRFVAATLASEMRVATALDGRTGLERALALRPDLIVSDIMMPELSGEELVREIRRTPALELVPIVLLTAKTDDELRVKLLREGAQDYLCKPFFAEELRARVRNLVAVKRARDILQREVTSQARDLETIAREIAQRRRELETALESARVARDHADQASRMKTSFLRMVSHELRTPLTSLKLNLDRLRRDREAPLAGRQLDTVRRIQTSTDRLLELIDSLLEYARLESGRLVVEVEPIDLRALASGVLEELSAQAEQKHIALHLLPSSDLPDLLSDGRLVRLVVVNLVGNAVKFTHKGAVEIRLSFASGEHRVEVRDSGPGIPPEDHERIFEPFEQREPVVNKHTPGVGLGLSIVKSIAAALGGRIELSSKVGEGSTFTVILPPLEETTLESAQPLAASG